MDLVAELAEEFARGGIYEATLITADGAHLEGLCDLTSPRSIKPITIDPKVSIVSVVLHELLHRRHPEWSETRVRRAEKRALRQLSQRDIQLWYQRYRRAVKKTRPVDAIDYKG